jgi:hypothetical protein
LDVPGALLPGVVVVVLLLLLPGGVVVVVLLLLPGGVVVVVLDSGGVVPLAAPPVPPAMPPLALPAVPPGVLSVVLPVPALGGVLGVAAGGVVWVVVVVLEPALPVPPAVPASFFSHAPKVNVATSAASSTEYFMLVPLKNIVVGKYTATWRNSTGLSACFPFDKSQLRYVFFNKSVLQVSRKTIPCLIQILALRNCCTRDI